MPIHGVCPACEVQIQLPDAAAGCGFSCVRCGASLCADAKGNIATAPPFGPPGAIGSGNTNPMGPQMKGAMGPPARNPFGPTANPFGEQVNPYAASGSAYAPAYFSPSATREMAMAKVRGPAILLQICGVLWILGALAFGGMMSVPLFIEPDRAMADAELKILAGLVIGGGALTIGFGIFSVVAGSRMKALRSYRLAMSAVVLSLIFGFLICPLVMLPVIWPLVVLLDPGVRANFDYGRGYK